MAPGDLPAGAWIPLHSRPLPIRRNNVTNPLLQPWDTPYGLPPFDRVRVEDFAPAFDVAMRDHLAELDALAADPAAPTFANTVAAFDRSGRLLGRLEGLFFNLSSSCTSPELQAAATCSWNSD